MPTDTFDDLAALAELQPPDPRYGRMLVKAPSGWWGYPGSPVDGTNLRIPRGGVSDARLRAAIAAGAWFAWEVDMAGNPVKAMPSTSVFAGRPAITPAEVGTARAHPPVSSNLISILRGTPPVAVPGDNAFLTGSWLAAWQAGATPNRDGTGIGDRHLTLRVPVPADRPELVPLAGDRLKIGAASYTVGAVVSAASNTYDVVLSRYVPPVQAAA